MELKQLLFYLIIILVFIFLVKRIKKRMSYKSKQAQVPSLSRKKEQHYESLGLTEQEIRFFRETMTTAKEQIDQLQKNMAAIAKLKAIDLRNDTIQICQSLFKEIVEEPTRLHLADKFLYTHLPNLLELTEKYCEINQHKVKDKETYTKLEESAQMIDEVSKLIKSDYQLFVAEDFQDLDVELSIAKQSVSRDNEAIKEKE